MAFPAGGEGPAAPAASGMTGADLVSLIGHLAWPVTLILLLAVFYRPISRLISTLAQRVTRFSAFKVQVELGQLSQAARTLEQTVERLKMAAITESKLETVTAGVMKTGSADYVVVEIGGDDSQNWLTSRLFLLAAILERSRAVRSIVFLGKDRRFVGVAAPRDVRNAIGARFLPYELALAESYGRVAAINDPNLFRGGASEAMVNGLSQGFLISGHVARQYDPNQNGWIKLDRGAAEPTTWEFADWVIAGGLRDILGDRLVEDAVAARPGAADPKTTKAILLARGPFVGMVDKAGSFQDLCDRYVILEGVARQAVQQVDQTEETSKPARPRARIAG